MNSAAGLIKGCDPSVSEVTFTEEEEHEVITLPKPIRKAVAPFEEPEILTPEEFFEACLEECNLDEIFADADRWAFHIRKNIAKNAGLHNEENDYALTGDEPEWMLELFKMNNVAIEAEEDNLSQ
ncbi:hypothetical protein [Synechococcus sp. UW179A]|uniref:hypothetical protein n=1 Tax=Synechococcus sp. UW179A TaxID=2575510 RepID=UPI000E0ED0D8|nr:hypothetical protein [Synechococcus sp. UW179A]